MGISDSDYQACAYQEGVSLLLAVLLGQLTEKVICSLGAIPAGKPGQWVS